MKNSEKDVPDNFPRDSYFGALSGAAPKLLARKIDGKYVVGPNLEEVFERWTAVEDIAQQLKTKVLKKLASGEVKEPHLYYVDQEKKIRVAGWNLTASETQWLMNRVKLLVDEKHDPKGTQSSLQSNETQASEISAVLNRAELGAAQTPVFISNA